MVLPSGSSRESYPGNPNVGSERGRDTRTDRRLLPGTPIFSRAHGESRTDEIVGDVRSGTIYGNSDSGQAISIWDAQRGNYTTGIFDGVREEFWRSSWICIGAHIPSAQESTITRAAITIDELYYLTDDGRLCPPDWVKIEGVEHPERLRQTGRFWFLTSCLSLAATAQNTHKAKCQKFTIRSTLRHPAVSQSSDSGHAGLETGHDDDEPASRPGYRAMCGRPRIHSVENGISYSAEDFVDRMRPIETWFGWRRSTRLESRNCCAHRH